MELITTKKQLLRNLETVENILVEGTDDEKLLMSNLIRKGKSIIAYQIKKEIRFAPSRFCGYVNNHLIAHANNTTKHGWDTNKSIYDILRVAQIESNRLDAKFKVYCAYLGVEPANNKRRFWQLKLSEDFAENQISDCEFPEGKIAERIHKTRERKSKLIAIAKVNFKNKYGRLFCEICGFDFEKKYGAIGKSFIEAHHTIPVSEMQPNHITKIEDIAMLCSNCHSMAHIKRPWLTMKKLNNLIKK